MIIIAWFGIDIRAFFFWKENIDLLYFYFVLFEIPKRTLICTVTEILKLFFWVGR